MKTPIDPLFEECKIAVRKELRKSCWKEAYKILELGDDKDRQDFIRYHKEDKGNICCLVLDFAKTKLIDLGKWKYNPIDCFNDPTKWLDNEDSKKE
jgi:hypothetical protein